MFRARVLHAYDKHCAVLQHAPLLDAAHIIPDTSPEGDASVVNRLSMCKIHHAAYDADLMGITPQTRVEVRPDVLDEADGPMLVHGLQAQHGQRLTWIPRSPSARPSEERLERRHQQFLASA